MEVGFFGRVVPTLNVFLLILANGIYSYFQKSFTSLSLKSEYEGNCVTKFGCAM